MARPTRSIIYSLLVHGAIILLLIVGFSWVSQEASNQPAAPEPIQATVINADKVNAEAEKLRLQAEKEAAAERSRQQAIKDKKARLAELKEKAAKAEAEHQAQLEAERKRKAEAAAKAKAEAIAEAEAKAKAAAEAKAKEEAARRAREAKEAAERRAREEAERRRQEELAAERAAREAQLQAALQAEERRTQAVRAGMLQQYTDSIAQKVWRNWIPPAQVPPDLRCVVSVTQAPGGIVLNAQIIKCNGGELVQNSILTATRKASPLPTPPPGAEFLFERKLKFIFDPEN